MDDRSILKLFLERSEDAVGELSKKYGAACLRLAESIVGSREDAEDCVNDAFLRVWSSVPPNEPELLGAYALRITRNLALNRLKFNNAEKRSALTVCLEELAESIPSGESVESLCEENELTGIIEDFLKDAGRENRLIFILRYWYLEGTRDIAERLGMSDPAVRARLVRIRRRLKKYLTEKGVGL